MSEASLVRLLKLGIFVLACFIPFQIHEIVQQKARIRTARANLSALEAIDLRLLPTTNRVMNPDGTWVPRKETAMERWERLNPDRARTSVP